jgi:hypothetical protein
MVERAARGLVAVAVLFSAGWWSSSTSVSALPFLGLTFPHCQIAGYNYIFPNLNGS